MTGFSVQQTDFGLTAQRFMFGVLDACHRPKRRRRKDARGNLLPDQIVPYGTTVVQILIDYAKTQKFITKQNDRIVLIEELIGQPEPKEDGIHFLLRETIGERDEEETTRVLPYLPGPGKELCKGNWTDIGEDKQARIDPECLLPMFQSVGSGAKAYWPNGSKPITRSKKWWTFGKELTINEITLAPDEGEINLGWLVVKLIWGE